MNEQERNIERRVEELLGRVPPPPSPSDDVSSEIRRRALDEFDRTVHLPDADTRWRRTLHTGVVLMSHPVSRVLVGLAAVLFLALWLGAPRRSVAFGDFLAPLVDAKTAKFKMVLKNDIQPKPMEMTGYYQTPAKFRQEMDGVVNISDFDQGRMLSLDEKNKKATLIKMKNLDEAKKNGDSGHLFGNLRTALADYRAHNKGQVEELGEKELDGQKVFGFRLAVPTMTQTIWGNAKTGNVVRIDATMPGPPKSEVVFSDFTFDMPLDAALFSVDPPADYKLTSFDVDVSPATEQEFIATLRAVSDAMDGAFPNGLDAAGIGAAVVKLIKAKPGEEPGTEAMSEAFKIGKGMNFALMLPFDADAHYAGKGVKRTDAKAPIFWYKPKDSQKYRVIFSDLTTDDVEAPPEVPGAVRIIEQLKKPSAE